MLTASGAHERAGAVAAIDALMEVETEENAARLPRSPATCARCCSTLATMP